MNLPGSFSGDLKFLNQHVATVVLAEDGPGRVVVVPEFQCRIMTSTTGHPSDSSFGWINYRRIAGPAEESDPNLFGGEDRIWLAPEGSRFSLFFDPGVPMDLAHWRVPAAIDRPQFQMLNRTSQRVEMRCRDQLVNYAGQSFAFEINRQVTIHTRQQTETALGLALPETIWHVAHASGNTLTNCGEHSWSRGTGLLAVWILGMYQPSPAAVVMIPWVGNSAGSGAPRVTTDYFGRPDASRLQIDYRRRHIYFRGDGQFRSKIGLPRAYVNNMLGAWDPVPGCLTIVLFNLPETPDWSYTNNLWRTDVDPFAGDVINAYNDGPNEAGGLLGPFYELETLSPALPLAPGESYTHIHRTIHLQGTEQDLDPLFRTLFGISPETLQTVLE